LTPRVFTYTAMMLLIQLVLVHMCMSLMCLLLPLLQMFPLRARSQAIAVATLVNFGSNCVVSVALPPLQEALGGWVGGPSVGGDG
jgi:hypothetical protein